jgi:hypothetical protein
LDLLIRLSARADEYGRAEFQAGMSEPDTTSVAAPATTTIKTIPVVGEAEIDTTQVEGFSVLQKGLFLAVILGVIAVYIRMNSKKGKQYTEKSMA